MACKRRMVSVTPPFACEGFSSKLKEGIFFANNTAFESSVHCNQFRRLTENLFVDVLEFADQFVVGFGLPSGVVAGVLRFETGHAAQGGHHASRGLFAGGDSAALAGDDLKRSGFRSHRGEVGGRLHEAGDVGAHSKNAVRNRDQEVDERLGVGGIQPALRCAQARRSSQAARTAGTTLPLQRL